jgi:hypothetical protein
VADSHAKSVAMEIVGPAPVPQAGGVLSPWRHATYITVKTIISLKEGVRTCYAVALIAPTTTQRV